jgi:hypothetical protein
VRAKKNEVNCVKHAKVKRLVNWQNGALIYTFAVPNGLISRKSSHRRTIEVFEHMLGSQMATREMSSNTPTQGIT